MGNMLVLGLGKLDYGMLKEGGFEIDGKYNGFPISLNDLPKIRYLQRGNVEKFLERIGLGGDPGAPNILAYCGEMEKDYFDEIKPGVDEFCKGSKTVFIYSHHHSLTLPFHIALKGQYDAAIILDQHIDAYHVKGDGKYYNDGNFLAHEGIPHEKLYIWGTPHAGLKWKLAERLKKDAYSYLTGKGAHCYSHRKKAGEFVGEALGAPRSIVFDVDVDVFKFSHSNCSDKGEIGNRKWKGFRDALQAKRGNIKGVRMVSFSEMNVYWVDEKNNPYDLIINPALDALGVK